MISDTVITDCSFSDHLFEVLIGKVYLDNIIITNTSFIAAKNLLRTDNDDDVFITNNNLNEVS